MQLRVAALLTLACAASAQTGAEPRTLELTLRRAVEIATSAEGNTRIQLAGEAAGQARSRSAQARAALLPNFDATVSQQSQTRNLAAFGLRLETPIPGVSIPRFVGPFSVFDARTTATQSLLDLSAIRRFHSSRAAVRGFERDQEAVSDQVAAQAAKAYLAAIRAQADMDAVQANIALAEAVLKQARNLKDAGTGTGIEITRAAVQLANERQRLLVAENQLRRARLQLLRVLNANLSTRVSLSERLAYHPVDAELLAQAEELALASRAELKAQREREESARLAAAAARWERIPSVAAFGDYGTIGTGVDATLPTRTVGVAMKIPLFDGGRRDARRSEAASQFRQEQIRTHDLQEQIRLEVILAADALRSADEQVKVAAEGLKLAEAELAQSRRRYEAGVTNSLEVTDAQTRLARARDNHVSALFNHEAARIDFGQATGLLDRLLD
jgi:outer membrane protein TolC